MSNQITFHERANLRVVTRDDGEIHLEIRDEEDTRTDAVVPMTPDFAVKLGELLISRGRQVLDLVQVQSGSGTAWRDDDGQVWIGEEGGDRLRPVGVDTDEHDHTWTELLAAYGPLTRVTQ